MTQEAMSAAEGPAAYGFITASTDLLDRRQSPGHESPRAPALPPC